MTVAQAPSTPGRGQAPDLSVWPQTARLQPGGDVAVGGVCLADVAERFGTPTYVLDETEVRTRARAYRAAFPGADVHYAAKAFLSRTVARWVHEEGLGIDACSGGEARLAVAAGVPAADVLLHGSAKTPADLRTVLRSGVGRIVIDGLTEIPQLASQVPVGTRQRVLVRVLPGIAAGAHPAIRTGTTDQHFGLSPTDGTLAAAVTRILARPALELVGLHCHLGSQITDVEPYLQAVGQMVALIAMIRDRTGVVLPELDLGGGHGIAYRPGDASLDVADLGRRVTAALEAHCATHDLPVPHLLIEPGRGLIGPAGVALYRVLTVKHTPQRTWVVVDGGMSDNPRPALYGQAYAPRLVGRHAHPDAPVTPVTVVGRHCEAGDVVAADVPLPSDVRGGDLLAVPVAGAYHLAMSSSYDMIGRPPVVAVRGGEARLLVRRESWADLVARDVDD